MAISGRQLRFRRSFPVIRHGTARLPRPLWGLAMTNLGAGSILSIPGTNRQCSAGRGMPLPYNGLYDRREYPEICNCPRRSLSAATEAIGAYYFNGGRYGLQVRRRARLSPPLHTRMPKLFRKDDVP